MNKLHQEIRFIFSPIIKNILNSKSRLLQCNNGGAVARVRRVHDSCTIPLRDLRMELKNKVAMVTGGASGIGFAIADMFLEEKARKVLLGDSDHCKGLHSAKKLCDKHGEGKCCYVPLNVCCTKQLADVLQNVQKNYTNLDILVNNAAVLTDDLDLEIDTNFRSVLFATNIAFKVMKNQPSKCGVVLNVGDVKGITACLYFPEYAAEKSGVHMFTIGSGRVSEKKHGVRVVGLAPGLTETELGEKFKGKPVSACNSQCPMAVGKAAAYVVKYGSSSSLWVVNRHKLLKLKMPSEHSILVMETYV